MIRKTYILTLWSSRPGETLAACRLEVLTRRSYKSLRLVGATGPAWARVPDWSIDYVMQRVQPGSRSGSCFMPGTDLAVSWMEE